MISWKYAQKVSYRPLCNQVIKPLSQVGVFKFTHLGNSILNGEAPCSQLHSLLHRINGVNGHNVDTTTLDIIIFELLHVSYYHTTS